MHTRVSVMVNVDAAHMLTETGGPLFPETPASLFSTSQKNYYRVQHNHGGLFIINILMFLGEMAVRCKTKTAQSKKLRTIKIFHEVVNKLVHNLKKQ